MNKTEQVQCVVAVILDQDGRALLGKRGPHKKSAPGYWCPVTGRIEAGESEEAALGREVREEVGLSVEPLRKVASFPTRDGSAMLHWWLVESSGGVAKVCNEEHTEIGWFDFSELDTLAPTFAEDISLLRRLQAEWLVQKGPTVVNGTELVENGRFLYMHTPRLPSEPVNCVWRSMLSATETDREMNKIISLHRAKNLPLWWLVGPTSTPDNLATRLKERGLKKEFDAFALGRRTRDLGGEKNLHVRVEKMNGENCVHYWRVFGKEPHPALQDWTDRSLAGEYGELEFFFATHQGELAGAATHRIFRNTAFLMSGFTKPEFRGRGVYRELLRHRLAVLEAKGVGWALTFSKAETSGPILRKLGFQEFGQYEMLGL